MGIPTINVTGADNPKKALSHGKVKGLFLFKLGLKQMDILTSPQTFRVSIARPVFATRSNIRPRVTLPP